MAPDQAPARGDGRRAGQSRVEQHSVCDTVKDGLLFDADRRLRDHALEARDLLWVASEHHLVDTGHKALCPVSRQVRPGIMLVMVRA